MGHLSINSLRKKFESIKLIIRLSFHLFLVLETKSDESFSSNRFSVSGCRMFRQYRYLFSEGFCIYVKENVASNVIKFTFR